MHSRNDLAKKRKVRQKKNIEKTFLKKETERLKQNASKRQTIRKQQQG